MNCFPNKITITSFSQESLFAKVKSPTNYAIYSQLKSIFGKTNYSMILRVPPAIIDELKNSNENKYVKKCFMKIEDDKDKKDKKDKKEKDKKDKMEKIEKKIKFYR